MSLNQVTEQRTTITHLRQYVVVALAITIFLRRVVSVDIACCADFRRFLDDISMCQDISILR